MFATLLEVGSPESCYPLTVNRSLSACCVANQRLSTVQRARLAEAGCQIVPTVDQKSGLGLFVPIDSWLSGEVLHQLLSVTEPSVLLDKTGVNLLAWVNSDESIPAAPKRIEPDSETFQIRYPWDLLRVNERIVGEVKANKIEGEVSSAATIRGFLELGPGSRILPGVFIEGNVLIGADCQVGPNCYIRGNTSIGDRCRIGQAVEIKNSLILQGTCLCHLSYCGDSVVGENVNFGAGTITANFRHDEKPHRSMVQGRLVETGRLKFGAVIGDGVHTGIHTSIYPGRKLWPGTSTRPGTVVQQDLMT